MGALGIVHESVHAHLAEIDPRGGEDEALDDTTNVLAISVPQPVSIQLEGSAAERVDDLHGRNVPTLGPYLHAPGWAFLTAPNRTH